MNTEMQLTRLVVSRQEYGKDKGRLSGKVEFSHGGGEVSLNLDEEMSLQVLRLCADGVVRASKELAANLTAETITTVAVPQLEDLE